MYREIEHAGDNANGNNGDEIVAHGEGNPRIGNAPIDNVDNIRRNH